MAEAMFVKYRWMDGTLIDWNIEEMTGYKPITTYYTDFSIADKFGEEGIRDTYERCREQAIEMGYTWLTELVMVLNWKSWEHGLIGNNEAFTDLYMKLWEELDEYAVTNLKGDELKYFCRTTD